jgi:hypothetical protein
VTWWWKPIERRCPNALFLIYRFFWSDALCLRCFNIWGKLPALKEDSATLSLENDMEVGTFPLPTSSLCCHPEAEVLFTLQLLLLHWLYRAILVFLHYHHSHFSLNPCILLSISPVCHFLSSLPSLPPLQNSFNLL